MKAGHWEENHRVSLVLIISRVTVASASLSPRCRLSGRSANLPGLIITPKGLLSPRCFQSFCSVHDKACAIHGAQQGGKMSLHVPLPHPPLGPKSVNNQVNKFVGSYTLRTDEPFPSRRAIVLPNWLKVPGKFRDIAYQLGCL